MACQTLTSNGFVSQMLEEVLHHPLPIRRQDGLGMELDAFDVFCLMPHAHDRAVGEVARDFEAVRERLAVDDEGVVAADGDVLGDAFVEAFAAIAERRARTTWPPKHSPMA